jgi:hypothetical protein
VGGNEFDRRNRWITGDYRRLSNDMRAFLGIDYLDWCGFAAWSSYTIGALVGDVKAPDNAFHRFPLGVRPLTRVVRRFLRGRDALGQMESGNLAIHREMSGVYRAVMSSDASLPRQQRIDAVLATARTAMVDDTPTTEAHWRSLTQGVTCLLATLDEHCGEPRRRELVMAAAAHFSAFEQSRVDHMLDEFLYAPTRRFRARWFRWLPGGFGDPLRRTVLEGISARFFTSFLTTLVTARGCIRLGERLPLPPPSAYPGDANPLEEISEPEALDVLGLYRDERAPDIADWSELDQRMRVIVAYFRAYQHLPEMARFEPLPELPPESTPPWDGGAAPAS